MQNRTPKRYTGMGHHNTASYSKLYHISNEILGKGFQSEL